MRDAAEAMVNGGWEGLLVPISSVNKVGQVGQLNYSSAKVADALMPKIIVGEFLMRGIRNIRCVAVAPGYTATPMLTGMNQDALKAILEDVHLGRLVAPEEIASLIGYCVENQAQNATTIEITGGLCYPIQTTKRTGHEHPLRCRRRRRGPRRLAQFGRRSPGRARHHLLHLRLLRCRPQAVQPEQHRPGRRKG